MTSRFKILMVCFGSVLFALSAISVGAAQAAPPVQPHYIINSNETLKSNVTIEDVSARTRLWSKALGLVIRCERDSSTGLIEPKGRDSGKVTYKECKVFTTKENADKQIEEGESLAKTCVVKEPIETAPLTSRIVWSKLIEGRRFLLILYAPVTPPTFVTIVVENNGTETCAEKVTAAVEGTLLGQVIAPRFNVESIANFTLFGTLNEASTILPEAKEWEVEENGRLETGKAELKLGTKISALEGVDQTERVREGTEPKASRSLFGIHE